MLAKFFRSFFLLNIIFCAASANASAAVDAIQAKNISQAEVLVRAAAELKFPLTLVDFSGTQVSSITPRGGGYIVDVVAVVAERYACAAQVIVAENGKVSEFVPISEFAGAVCGETGRGGVSVGNNQ